MTNVVPFNPRLAEHQPGSGPEAEGTPSTPTPISRAVYTVKEVAELLDLSLGSTYALIRTGDIPARKLGGRWVVPKHRFHDWLNQHPDTTDEDERPEQRQHRGA